MHVPLLSGQEIKEIINQGCKLLNISMSDNLTEKISYYSNRLASLTHQMLILLFVILIKFTNNNISIKESVINILKVLLNHM